MPAATASSYRLHQTASRSLLLRSPSGSSIVCAYGLTTAVGTTAALSGVAFGIW